jgi:hypothetical protein
MEAVGFFEMWIIFYKNILYHIPEAHIFHGIMCVCVCVCVCARARIRVCLLACLLACGELLYEEKTMPLLHEAVVGAHMSLRCIVLSLHFVL